MEINAKKQINQSDDFKRTQNQDSKIVPIWKSQLDRYENGRIKNSLNNFKLILENDERFKGKIRFNEFTTRTMMLTRHGYVNVDDNIITNILLLIEKEYDGINKRDLIEKVVDIVGENNKFHPIRDYLNNLKWDGKPRLATAFADYFGCEASRYNEYCLRTFLNGAIARVLHPRSKI